MSDVKRYDMVLSSWASWQDLEVAEGGDWVKSEDYDAKCKEVERLHGLLRWSACPTCGKGDDGLLCSNPWHMDRDAALAGEKDD